MSFYKFWRRRSGKGSSNKDILGFDLFFQLSYMSTIAATGISRSLIFEYAAQLPCTCSRYFKDVHILTQHLNYDYAEACCRVAESAEEEEVKSLLLRLSASLIAGEREADFLAREAQVLAESYGNQYERGLESLKKWSDAYTALNVSAVLIVIVALISTLIYEMGTAIVMGLAGAMVLLNALGVWILYRVAPKEIKTHSLPGGPKEQHLSKFMFRVLLPATVVVSSSFALGTVNLGWGLILASALLFPVGLVSVWNDRKINKRDEEIGTFLRTIGGVASAVGTTLTEALNKIDLRSMGSLEPPAKRLRTRLVSAIKPELSWGGFVAETGSELINRSVSMFTDAVGFGGEAEEAGLRSSLFAIKVALLRAKRRLVSSTFGGLSIAMHATMIWLLVFIAQIMSLFAGALQAAQPGNIPEGAPMPTGGFFIFDFETLHLFDRLIVPIVVVFTVVNALAPKIVDGGHNYKILYYVGIMMAISGAGLLCVPKLVELLFGSIGL